MDEFHALFDVHFFAPGSLLILGDFYIHVNATNTQAQSFNDHLNSYGFVQHINEPTHVHGHTLGLLISRWSDDR